MEAAWRHFNRSAAPLRIGVFDLADLLGWRVHDPCCLDHAGRTSSASTRETASGLRTCPDRNAPVRIPARDRRRRARQRTFPTRRIFIDNLPVHRSLPRKDPAQVFTFGQDSGLDPAPRGVQCRHPAMLSGWLVRRLRISKRRPLPRCQYSPKGGSHGMRSSRDRPSRPSHSSMMALPNLIAAGRQQSSRQTYLNVVHGKPGNYVGGFAAMGMRQRRNFQFALEKVRIVHGRRDAGGSPHQETAPYDCPHNSILGRYQPHCLSRRPRVQAPPERTGSYFSGAAHGRSLAALVPAAPIGARMDRAWRRRQLDPAVKRRS